MPGPIFPEAEQDQFELVNIGPGTELFQMAIDTRRPEPGTLVHHSDRGLQYACSDYTDILNAHGILTSMSRVANPYDNAKAESFMKTLKHEEVDGSCYRDVRHARRNIRAFLEDVYNQQRLHSALDYRSPVEFEAMMRDRIPGIVPVAGASSLQSLSNLSQSRGRQSVS